MSEPTHGVPAADAAVHHKAFLEIETLLWRALAHPAFRRRWGLTRTSQSFVAAPGWFLWSTRRRGVHALEVTAARWDAEIHGLGPFLWLRLGVKYYPHPEEPMFEDFSAAEKLLRLSPVFGERGVPAPPSYGRVHPSFFGVGLIEGTLLHDGTMAWLSLRAPDRWREIREAGLTVPGPAGDVLQVTAPGDRDRNVPGWTLSWLVFAPLAAAFALGPGARFRSALAATRPAPTTLVKSDGTVQESLAHDNLERRYDAWLLLSTDPQERRRLGRAVDRWAREPFRDDPERDRRPWHLAHVTAARGRRTLPPFPGALPS